MFIFFSGCKDTTLKMDKSYQLIRNEALCILVHYLFSSFGNNVYVCY
ncbi:hypothetical protein M084_3329 [Bacteroides fragilis str. 3988 T1]|nr:hypothetical protein M084_3329 [Bacteroides fragilis str. 3988 T1]